MSIADKAYANGYETEYERKLLGNDGKEVGVTIWLRGLDCDASIAVHDEYQKKVTDMRIRAGDKEIPEGVVGELVIDEMRDRYIACISRWDFAGEELFDGEGEPLLDADTVKRFFNIPLFGKQIREWVSEVGDFIPA